jgi:TonB-linked SusC/RagA family outer membrane protein
MKRILLILLAFGICVTSNAYAQSKQITGKVTASDDGLPIIGASIKAENSTVGTQSDASGNYSITVPAGTSRLTVSYVGYTPQTVSIGNRSVVNLVLVGDNSQLNEVVVTGYTSSSRDKSTVSSTKVSAKNIENVPIGSFDQVLQGRVPGLSVLAGTGQPGAVATVYVRGATSINGSNTPLYIVDGVPVEPSVFSTLNPNEFESVDVLKDAAATSLYGSRGATGVLVITTKRGKAGKTVFNYDVQVGFSERSSTKFNMLTTQEQLSLQNTLRLGPGFTLSPSNTAAVSATVNGQRLTLTAAQKARALDSLGQINTQWDDLFFRKGSFQSHQLSASGGNENTRFYTALSYYSQEGIAIRSKLDRYNLRFNLDHTAGKLKLGLQSGIGWSKSNFVESEAAIALANPFAAAYLALPYESPYYNGGSQIYTTNWAGQSTTPFPVFDSRLGSNALSRIDNTFIKNNQLKQTLSLNLSYEFFKGFTAKSTLGVDFRETVNESGVYPLTLQGSQTTNGGAGSYSTGNSRNLQLIQTSGFQYLNSFGKHDFFATTLFETIRNRLLSFNYTAFGINPALLNTPAGVSQGAATAPGNTVIPTVGGGKTQSGINSYIAIVKDTYADKYTLQVSVRRDGSSQVPAVNRWHNFFSVSGNWNAKKEDFLQDVKWLDVLRLRASYGTTATPFGTGNGNNFGYLALYSATNYAGLGGIAPSTPGNPEYNWEFTKQTDVGVEFGFFNNRLRSTVDLYIKNTNNLFVSRQLSATSGFGSVNVNAGSMRNKGIEFQLEGDVVKSKDWLVNIFSNFAYNKNSITSLGQVNQFEQGTSIIRTGLPLGSHYTVKSAGVDPQTGNYLYYNRDGSTTTTYSAATQSVAEFGTFYAPYQGGFGLNLNYKTFSISSLFSYAQQFSRFNNQSFFLTNPANIAAYGLDNVVNTVWTTPGQITTIGGVSSQRQFNSVDIQDASFVRFRNLLVSYNLPQTVVKKLKYFSSVRIFAQGQNLYTWTKWTGFDPEDSNNLASFEYPTPRTFTFGLSVNL